MFSLHILQINEADEKIVSFGDESHAQKREKKDVRCRFQLPSPFSVKRRCFTSSGGYLTYRQHKEFFELMRNVSRVSATGFFQLGLVFILWRVLEESAMQKMMIT